MVEQSEGCRGGRTRGVVDNVDIGRPLGVTFLLTVLLIWSWGWSLNEDPAFPNVGPRYEHPAWTQTPAFVPPFNEPSTPRGASKFWSNDPGEDSIFFHGIIDEPLMRSR